MAIKLDANHFSSSFLPLRYYPREDSAHLAFIPIYQVAAAAVAAPRYLGPITLQISATSERTIRHGGFGCPINPTAIALAESEHDTAREIGTIVSVGTASHSTSYWENRESSPSESSPSDVHQKMQEKAERLGLEYYRLEPDPTETAYHVTLEHPDEWDPGPSSKGEKCGASTMGKMQAAFDRWLENPDVQNHFFECAQALVARRRWRTQHKVKWLFYAKWIDVFMCSTCTDPTGSRRSYSQDELRDHYRAVHVGDEAGMERDVSQQVIEKSRIVGM